MSTRDVAVERLQVRKRALDYSKIAPHHPQRGLCHPYRDLLTYRRCMQGLAAAVGRQDHSRYLF